MSTFSIIAFPLLGVGLALVSGYYKKKDRNYLVPGLVLIAAGFVNAAIGLSLT